MRTIFLAPIMALFSLAAVAQEVHPCFTPGEDCTGIIVGQIAQAKSSILIQAYSFTSQPIEDALIEAHNRGVTVEAIFDKSQARRKPAQELAAAGIPSLIDTIRGIAHNKVVIIDNQTVLTGSFNFTEAAQKRNAENLVVINSPIVGQEYADNWHQRETHSEPFTQQQEGN